MAYKKRFEDSYLDEETEDFDGSEAGAEALLMKLLMKKDKTEKDVLRMNTLATMITSVEAWARIAETAEAVGNREFYYLATDKMSGL